MPVILIATDLHWAYIDPIDPSTTKMTGKGEPVRVLIAGAGIAGLATAISLTRKSTIPNLDIQLYEQAPELLEIGASIALSPNVGLSRFFSPFFWEIERFANRKYEL